MKSKDDRYTVAYESKAFPYFTINVKPPGIMDGNLGGVMAFFERCEFVRENREMIDGLGIYVNADCGFHVSSESQWEHLHAAICVYYFCRAASGEGWKHEAF